MKKEAPGIVLARTLDRLKACADGCQTRVCLTSEECMEVCAYIWWLTDEIAKRQGADHERN